MTTPNFLTVADAVRASELDFEAVVYEALRLSMSTMTAEDVKRAFPPALEVKPIAKAA